LPIPRTRPAIGGRALARPITPRSACSSWRTAGSRRCPPPSAWRPYIGSRCATTDCLYRTFDMRMSVPGPNDSPRRSYRVTLLATVIVGCSSQVPTYPVHGKVVYQEDGQPVCGGVTIWFESTTPPYERASGVVDGAGNFTLSTVREGSGAMKGEHRIRFEPAVPYSEPTAARALAKRMPPRYLEYRTSGLTRTITTGDNYFVIEGAKPPRP